MRLDALDDRVRIRWHMILEDRGPVGGADPSHVGQVLDRDRQPGEPSSLSLKRSPLPCHEPLRVVAGALEAEGGQSVHVGLNGGDARLRRVDEVERRNLAPPQAAHGFACGQSEEIVMHRRSLAPCGSFGQNGHGGRR